MMMRLLSTTYLLAAQVLLFLPASIKKVEGADGHVTPSELRELLRLERRLLNLSCCHDKLDEARQELEELLQPSDVDPTVHPLKVLTLYIHWTSFDWKKLLKCPSEDLSEFLGQLPIQADVASVCGHVLRLCQTYNLTLSHVLDGRLMGLDAVRPMNMKECFLVADAAYQMIDAREYQNWHLACQQIVPASKAEISFRQRKIQEFPRRQEIIGLLSKAASATTTKTPSSKPSEKKERIVSMLTQHLSTEAYQNIHSRSSNNAAADDMYEEYRRLCRGSLSEALSEEEEDSTLHCFIDSGSLAKVELLSLQPVVALFHDILSQQERKVLMSAAIQADFQVPQTVSAGSGVIQSDVQKRTGKIAFVQTEPEEQSSNEIYQRILSQVKGKTSRLSGLMVEEEGATEPLQVVNYGVGGHYEPHVDFFGDSLDLVEGDRVATMLFYLGSSPQQKEDDQKVVGGATVFPFLHLAVKPQSGAALFWYNTKRGGGGGGDPATLHAGCPVLYGTKWIANLWIRERSQVFVRPCQAF